jgi:hypothetical protein
MCLVKCYEEAQITNFAPKKSDNSENKKNEKNDTKTSFFATVLNIILPVWQRLTNICMYLDFVVNQHNCLIILCLEAGLLVFWHGR